MYCHGCGTELTEGASFCGKCGMAAGAVEPPPVAMPRPPHDLPAYTRTVVRFIWANLVMAVAEGLTEIPVLMTSNLPESHAGSIIANLVSGIVGLAQSAVGLVTAVFFLIWVYRAAENCIARGARMSISPGWAVAYYFLPVLNLYMPFHAMREAWRASHDPVNPDKTSTPPILRKWWALWLGSNFISTAAALGVLSGSRDAAGVSAGLSIVGAVIDIALCFAAARVLTTIAGAQAAWETESVALAPTPTA